MHSLIGQFSYSSCARVSFANSAPTHAHGRQSAVDSEAHAGQGADCEPSGQHPALLLGIR